MPSYLKGVRATKPRFDVAEKAFEALIQYTAKRPDMNMSCMFEYFPLAKICSVANDATAYVRVPYGNVLNIIRWTEDTEENLKFARDAAKDISHIVLKGNIELAAADNTAYGNYGVLVSVYVYVGLLTFCSDPEISVDDTDGELAIDKAQVLFGDNYPRLQELKMKYDPEVLFSKWFAITPA